MQALWTQTKGLSALGGFLEFAIAHQALETPRAQVIYAHALELAQ